MNSLNQNVNTPGEAPNFESGPFGLRQLLNHVIDYKVLYATVVSWAIVGAILPSLIAVIYSLVTFFFLMRRGDSTTVFFAFLLMLVFSDSRSDIMLFAKTAKIGTVVGLGIYLFAYRKTLRISNSGILRYFILFLAYILLTNIWAQSGFVSIQKSLSFVLIFTMIPIAFQLAKDENSNIGVDLVYMFTVMLLLGFAVYVLAPNFVVLAGRYRGFLGNPNGLGVFLTFVFAIYYLTSLQHKELMKGKFKYLFYALFSASIILSGSRTALIAMVIFFVFNQLRKLPLIVSVIGFLIILVSYNYLLQQLPYIILALDLQDYFRLETLSEGSGRFIAWGFAWERIQDNFLYGGGFGHTENVFRSSYMMLSNLGHQGNAHNSYLTLWLDTGLVGLIFFLIGLARVIGRGLTTQSIALPIALSVLFSSFFESWLAGSLNPVTSLFLIVLVMLINPYSDQATDDDESGDIVPTES